MKKDELYEICANISDINDLVLEMLPKMIELKGIDSHLFYKTCIKNSNIITEENFYNTFLIFLNLCYLDDISSKQEFYKMFNEFIEKDYIYSSQNFNLILKTIANLLVYPVYEVFRDRGEESDYYKLKLIEQYFLIFRRNSNDYENTYKHDFDMISTQFIELLTDLPNTEEEITENFNDTMLKRVEIFTKIVNDEKNLTFDEIKYQSIVEIAVSIDDLSQLTKFKNRVKLLSNDMGDTEFSLLLEQYTTELNWNTIDLIYQKLNIEITECDGIEVVKQEPRLPDDEKINELKKLLLPDKKD